MHTLMHLLSAFKAQALRVFWLSGLPFSLANAQVMTQLVHNRFENGEISTYNNLEEIASSVASLHGGKVCLKQMENLVVAEITWPDKSHVSTSSN